MKVWIDQDLCQGSGVCEEVCPDVFTLDHGDVAFILDGNEVLVGGQTGTLDVPAGLEAEVLAAADACPTGCISIE